MAFVDSSIIVSLHDFLTVESLSFVFVGNERLQIREVTHVSLIKLLIIIKYFSQIEFIVLEYLF